ncbi:MAG TPA: RNA polymerase sigma factor [Stellaceae bacterium]|nr:RNA polymerase sigma factor [Stellaceae bacterium]
MSVPRSIIDAGPQVRMLAHTGSDVKLLPRLLAGETTAFRILVATHHAAMTRFARAIVGDAAAAEDVVQEAWLKAIRGISGFEGRSSLRTWLLSIVRNEAINRRRKDAREPVSEGIDNLADRFDSDDGWYLPRRVRSLDTPEALLSAKEIQAVIDKTLEKIRPAERACFNLVNLDGLSYEGVCGVLGISASNARVSCYRTRQRLRTAIDAYRAA